jgi:hypothetical protein
MTREPYTILNDYKVKTFRWLFYMSLFQLFVFFLVPTLMVPLKILLSLEILAALTVGVLIALFFLGVNIYGLFVDKRRKKLYTVIIIFMTAWVLWAFISWLYIEYMDYLLR